MENEEIPRTPERSVWGLLEARCGPALDTEPFLARSLKEAAILGGVSTMTIHRWMGKGLIPRPTKHTPVSAKVLRETKAAQARLKIEKVRAHALGRRKYHTPQEVRKARYLRVKAWRHANAEENRRDERIRRRLKRHPAWETMKADLLSHYGSRCLCCRKRVATCLDHVVPLSMGGRNHPVNLQPLCRSCNTAKRMKSTDYRRDQGAYIEERWGGWWTPSEMTCRAERSRTFRKSHVRVETGCGDEGNGPGSLWEREAWLPILAHRAHVARRKEQAPHTARCHYHTSGIGSVLS